MIGLGVTNMSTPKGGIILWSAKVLTRSPWKYTREGAASQPTTREQVEVYSNNTPRFMAELMMVEDGSKNYCLHSSDLTRHSWRCDGMILNQNQVIAARDNAELMQEVEAPEGLYQISVDLRRIKGLGRVHLSADNGITWHRMCMQGVTNKNFVEYEGANPIIRLRVEEKNTHFFCRHWQVEPGRDVTSWIPTDDAPAVRPPDTLFVPLGAVPKAGRVRVRCMALRGQEYEEYELNLNYTERPRTVKDIFDALCMPYSAYIQSIQFEEPPDG